MKTLVVLFSAFWLIIAVPVSSNEQVDGTLASETVEYLLARKRQTITDTVEFDPEEETRFWPLFDAYEKEIEPVLLLLARLLDRHHEKIETLTEQEADLVIDELIAANSESIAIQISYLNRIRQILPAKKVLHVSYAMLTP